MAQQRKGLGKGLDALIPGGKSSPSSPSTFVSSGGGVLQVAVELIQPNPDRHAELILRRY